MFPRHLWSAYALGALLLGASYSSGCVPTDSTQDDDPTAIEESCQLVAACEGGNAADRSACIIGTEVEQSDASVTGCTEEFDAFIACGQENNVCSNGQLTFQCDSEEDAFKDCLSSAKVPVGDEPATSSAAKAWCAEVTVCSKLSEVERWRCEIQFDGYLDTARAYGCSDEAATVAACAPVDNECLDPGRLAPSGACDVAFSNMFACIMAGSSL